LLDIPTGWEPRAKQSRTVALLAALCAAALFEPLPSRKQKRKTSTQCVLVFLGAMEGTRTPGLLIRRNRMAHSLHCLHVFAPVIHPCDVQKMCKSVQRQNQPGKTGCFAQPQKLDFNGIYCTKFSIFIQTTILHDTSVLWQGLGHPNRHHLIEK